VRRTFITALLCVIALVTACSDSDDDVASTGGTDPTTAPAEAQFPVTVEAANGEVTIEAQPEQIVSLSPTATEMVFAIGAGDQVVAVDDQSDYPEGVPTTDLSGYSTLFNAEAVASYEPDLVVMADDAGDSVKALEAIEIPVLNLTAAATLEDTYEQLEILGDATGHPEEASAVVEEMRSDIDELTADLPQPEEPLTYYHELDDTLFSVTSETFIGQVYALAGLENVADSVGEDAGGYPQLSAEFLVDSDPDLIFLADTECCQQNAETLAARPGFGGLSAVTEGNVVELSDDVASRWGPRVVDFLESVIDAVEAAQT
jgi:iron complex transport system substrate-binding protein